MYLKLKEAMNRALALKSGQKHNESYVISLSIHIKNVTAAFVVKIKDTVAVDSNGDFNYRESKKGNISQKFDRITKSLPLSLQHLQAYRHL